MTNPLHDCCKITTRRQQCKNKSYLWSGKLRSEGIASDLHTVVYDWQNVHVVNNIIPSQAPSRGCTVPSRAWGHTSLRAGTGAQPQQSRPFDAATGIQGYNVRRENATPS